MLTNLLSASYPAKSSEVTTQRLVNMYLQRSPNETTQLVAYSRPGLTEWTDNAGASEVRALYEQNDVLYAVVDNKLYSYNAAKTRTELGTLTTSSGICQIVGTNIDILVNDKTNVYNYNIAGTTFSTVTLPAAFTSGTETITAQDGYFFAHVDQKFYLSNLNDGTTWGTTDFASAEGDPDDLVAIKSFQRKIFLIGTKSTEIWFNTGNSFPFGRVEGIFINFGCEASDSVAEGDNNIFWLAKGKNGTVTVLQVDESYQDTIISNEGLENSFAGYTTNNAIGFVYRWLNKEFYVLTFPTDDVTWVYDVELGIWTEYDSYNGSSYIRWIPNNYAFFDGKGIVGDFNDGKFYELSSTTYKDNSQNIRRILQTPHLQNEDKVGYITRLHLDVQNDVANVDASDPTVTLNVSRDGGFSFGSDIAKTIGESNDYTKRLLFNKLGSARKFVFKFTITDPVDITILGVYVEAEGATE